MEWGNLPGNQCRLRGEGCDRQEKGYVRIFPGSSGKKFPGLGELVPVCFQQVEKRGCLEYKGDRGMDFPSCMI
jgi:hypothetical protein